MIGGDKAIVERSDAAVRGDGQDDRHQGGPGAGQHTKMVNQILIAGTMVGVCEACCTATRPGSTWRRCSSRSAAAPPASWALDNLGPRIIERNFEPGFFVEHFIKDMGIALAEAERMNIALPGLALVHQLYIGLRAQGHGRRGTQALMLALERMSKTGPDAKAT